MLSCWPVSFLVRDDPVFLEILRFDIVFKLLFLWEELPTGATRYVGGIGERFVKFCSVYRPPLNGDSDDNLLFVSPDNSKFAMIGFYCTSGCSTTPFSKFDSSRGFESSFS